MKPRIDLTKTSPQVLRALFGLSAPIEASGLEPALLELVKMRASQINGCAYCIDMHTKDARALGETEQRLYLLDAWRETNLYNERERAALAWTEAVTLVTQGHVRFYACYLHPDACALPADACMVLEVSPLVRELMDALVRAADRSERRRQLAARKTEPCGARSSASA